jgi:hypothetical protein
MLSSVPCRCLLLVCVASQVSVSVRPGRRSATGTTRDSGHHSRFVQRLPLLATAAPVIGADGASCWKAIHRMCPCPRARGYAAEALSLTCPAGSGRSANRIARSVVLTRRGGRHLGASLAKVPANRGALGLRARRHYRLTPVVTTRSWRRTILPRRSVAAATSLGTTGTTIAQPWRRLRGGKRRRCPPCLAAAGLQEAGPVRALVRAERCVSCIGRADSARGMRRSPNAPEAPTVYGA